MDHTDVHEPTRTLDDSTQKVDESKPRPDDTTQRIAEPIVTPVDWRPSAEPTVAAPTTVVPKAASPPVRSRPLTFLGLVWALALIAAGAVGIHEALVAADVVDRAWMPRAIEYVDGVSPSRDVLMVAVAAGIIGLVLVGLALWPRRRHRIALRSPAGVYVRQSHLERLLAGRMETLDGVLRCRVDSRRQLVDVEARSIAGVDPGQLYGRIASQVRDDLDLLPRLPDLRIVVREAD